MKKPQRGQTLRYDNLQESLDASPDALRVGNQQFETPLPIAEVLALPLPPHRPVICDLQCGRGNLLAGARNASTFHRLGLDIDPSCGTSRSPVIIGDIGRVYPLMVEVSLTFDLLVLNPPFGLRWVRPNGEPGLIDSTLATWQMANARLSERGEGFMICNAATARRLLGNDPAIWLWLEMPNFFPGTSSEMRVAVIYFCKAGRAMHGQPPITIQLDSAQPEVIRAALQPFADWREDSRRGLDLRKAQFSPRAGRSVWHQFDTERHTVARWAAAQGEWQRLQDERLGKIQWNISLGRDGRIERYLTPFEILTAKVPAKLVDELNKLHGKLPMQLVVQKPTRLALQQAVNGGVWRVEPQILHAVQQAVADYNAVRAPFIALNPVQRIGYLDEEDSIRCSRAFAGFSPGSRYPMTSETFAGRKGEHRKRVGKDSEWVVVSGQELMIKITDGNGRTHAFTQFPLTLDEQDSDLPKFDDNHQLSALAEYFEIPQVADVAQMEPARFQTYVRRLHGLESF